MIEIDGREERNLHFKWTSDIQPVAKVGDGETVHIIVPDSSTMQIKSDYTTSDMGKIDGSKFDAAVGPIYVEGAEKGDVLEVEIVDIKVGSWGWSAIIKDFGFMKNVYDERLLIWDIKDGFAQTRGDFLKGIKIPVNPFLGVTGVAPEKGEFGMIPPQYFGGNMDNKLLTKGSKIYFPVNQPGALLSISDPHAYQGDGEICGTAIETSADVKLKVKVHKSKNIRFPQADVRETVNSKLILAMGIANDLHTAARYAFENMVERMSERGLKPDETYILCSVAGNLRISEIVDEPNFVVSLTIPEEIFEK